LIVLKLRRGKGHSKSPFCSRLSCLVCLSRLAWAVHGTRAPLIAMVLLAGIGVLYFVMRPKEPVAVAD
jgi:hypothetical protein